MTSINILPKNFAPWGIANQVSFNVDFYLGMTEFTIIAQFYDSETPIGTPLNLLVNGFTIQDWQAEAQAHPEKAGFLDFTIIKEWCLKQLDLEEVTS